MTGWRRSIATYTDRRVLLVLTLGFASGLPLLLTYTTLSAWLATVGVRRAAIGAFALVGTPYAFKFVWSPLIDWLPPPLPLGRRRGWGVTIQIALIARMLALGFVRSQTTPRRHGGVGAARGVSLRQPGHRDRCVACRNSPARSAGAGRGNDPDRLPRRDAGCRGRRTGDRVSPGLVRGLRNHGGAADRGNARVLVRPRASIGGGCSRCRDGCEASGLGCTSSLDVGRGDRTVRRFHAPADLGGDPSFCRRVQAGRSDGGRDGDATLHLARFLSRRDRGCLQGGWVDSGPWQERSSAGW